MAKVMALLSLGCKASFLLLLLLFSQKPEAQQSSGSLVFIILTIARGFFSEGLRLWILTQQQTSLVHVMHLSTSTVIQSC